MTISPAMQAAIDAHQRRRDAMRPICDRLALASLAVGDAVAEGREPTPKQGDELFDAAVAFRNMSRAADAAAKETTG